jgi:hypothetical protein
MDKDLSVTEDHTIFIQDTSDKKGCARAATRICGAIDNYKYYVWVRADLTDKEQKAEVDALIAELDFPVKYVKDLPDDGPRQSGPRAKIMVSLYNNGLTKYDMDDATFKAGGYYFPMSNNDIPYHIRRDHMVSKDKFGKDVVFVPKTLWKKFEDQSNWISFEPALKKLVEEEAPNVRKVFGNKYNIYPFTNFRSLSEAGGVVGEFAKKASEDRPSYHLGLVCAQWTDLLRHYSLPMFSNQGVEAEYKSLLDKYPLLALGNVSENVKDFVRYVQLIDNAAKE